MRFFLLLTIYLASWTTAYAWNWQGHQVVAFVAERHLTPKARREVEKLLATEGKTSMSEVSSWADFVRELPSQQYPNHSVRLPLNNEPYDAKRDCRENHCILAGIDEDIAALSNPKMQIEARTAALKYLVHFLGDLHQPLHDSVDTGGRQVDVDGEVMELHRVWDRQIIRDFSMDMEKLVDVVDATDVDVPDGTTPAQWAEAGRDIARDQIFAELPDAKDGEATRLSENYLDRNWPLAKVQLKLGGMRLAGILNRIFR